MEEGGGEEASSTPFWVQRTTDHRRGASSLPAVVLLVVTAVFVLAFVLPKTVSSTAQIFKPNSVKKSWDSLNLVLVLVALVFGFISRNKINNNDDGYSPLTSPLSSSYYNEFQDSPPAKRNEAQMYRAPQRQSSLVRRNVSSYPDLRGFASIDWYNEDIKQRYYDDTYPGRVSDLGKIHRRHRSLEQVDESRTGPQRKAAVIDTLLSRYDADVKLPAVDRKSLPADPPSQPPDTRVEGKREKLGRNAEKEVEPVKDPAPRMDADPPAMEEAEGGGSGRKRGGATKDFLNSLYHKKKTKKQRQRCVDKLEIDSLVPPPSSPLKPPSPALKNLFSLKKQKRKKTITVSLKPSSAAREAKPISKSSRKTKSAPQVSSSASAHKLQKRKVMSLFDNMDEISNSGGESPMNRIPPAPPPPPPGFLSSPTWKFVVRGDYVRVNSSASSRSESPDIDDLESDFAGDSTTPFRGSSPLFYQSPSVDTKAESFISSFRAKLKLEKMNSVKREVGLSGLGPRVGPTHI